MNSFQLPLDFSTEEPVAPSGLPIPLPALMDQWVASGWLRRVDRAVARWLMAQAPRADQSVILALVLASHQAGQGHVCLDLVACLGDPDAVLKMPPRDDFSIRGMRLPPRPSSVLRGWTLNDWTAVLAAESHLVEVINGRSAVGPVADQGTETPDVPPFVLDGTRLYLRRYWQQEQAIAVRILSRLAGARPSQDAGAIRETLDRLFGPTVTNDEADWQKIACSLAVRHPFSIITGGPGTGKTTTVVKFLMLSQILAIRAGLPAPRIRLCAPTGKAAARLKQSILGQIAALLTQFDSAYPTLAEALPQTVDTLHRLIGVRPNQARPTHHEANWLAADIVVIDEASMIGLELMARTLAALAPDTQLVLLGDRDQLASVEPGAVLGALCAHAGVQVRYAAETCAWIRQTTGFSLEPATEPGSRLEQATVTLRHSHRFGPDSQIGDLAQSVNSGDAAAACRLLQAAPPHESLRLLLDDHRSSGLAQLVVEVLAPWLRLAQSPPESAGPSQDDWARAIFVAHQQVQVLCALRQGHQGVIGLNALIERALHRAGLLPEPRLGDEAWYAGRPVLVTRNDAALQLTNGDIGLTLPYRADSDEAHSLSVAFLGDDPEAPIRWLNPHRLPPCATAFALTVHKAQGSEFGHALFVLPSSPNPILTRELIYTALTRARDRFTLIGSVDDPALTILADGIRRRVQRAGQLDVLCGV